MSILKGKIYGINGPVLTVVPCAGQSSDSCTLFSMSEMVLVGKDRLLGEVIGISKDRTIIQVYEDTSGLAKNDDVYGVGSQLALTLAPGIVGNIFDGVERPLLALEKKTGIFINKGSEVEALDTQKLWETKILVKPGDIIYSGSVIAEVPETGSILHKVMLPTEYGNNPCEVVWAAANGSYTINDSLVKIKYNNDMKDVCMMRKWPIRKPRPITERQPPSRPLITGQRVIDTLFPIAKGGMAALPGGFGTGKTMTQHQLAKWSDADLIVYIGCGERGNEMTQVLEDFSKLIDPRTQKALMERTVLIANTSNMPVAAREASIYTGITIAEYYRDMGYHVAVMADSTSRWAEALRELSGRLEEMPAEEGFPAYLASRLAAFYERAGYVKNLNGTEGSITIIGAVSPQGGDFSEPVTQNTKRFVRCFWTLDKNLAYARHFPAINWLSSYSEYLDDLTDWYNQNVGVEFLENRLKILKILQDDSELMDIVRLIGVDVLPDSQKLVLEIARVIRFGFVQQNAYHSFDTFAPFQKQSRMMQVILKLYDKSRKLISMGIPMRILQNEDIFAKIIGIKYNVSNEGLSVTNGKTDALTVYEQNIDEFYDKVYEANM